MKVDVGFGVFNEDLGSDRPEAVFVYQQDAEKYADDGSKSLALVVRPVRWVVFSEGQADVDVMADDVRSLALIVETLTDGYQSPWAIRYRERVKSALANLGPESGKGRGHA